MGAPRGRPPGHSDFEVAMLSTLGKRLFGTANDRYIKRLAKDVEAITTTKPIDFFPA